MHGEEIESVIYIQNYYVDKVIESSGQSSLEENTEWSDNAEDADMKELEYIVMNKSS